MGLFKAGSIGLGLTLLGATIVYLIETVKPVLITLA